MNVHKIHVQVIKYPDRDNLVMRFRDPREGKLIQRSTGTTNKHDARRLAHQWETELNRTHGLVGPHERRTER